MRAAKMLVASILVLSGLAAVLIGTAEAKKQKADVKFTTIQPDLVAGKLKTNVPQCLKGRTVVIKYAPFAPLRATGAAWRRRIV